MDLSKSLKPVEREYQVKNPADGSPTGLILTLACTHDDNVKKAIREARDLYLKAVGDEKPTEQQLEDYEHKLMAAHIIDCKFTGEANWKGETPEFSKALALEMCQIHAIKQQVVEEVKKVKDFYNA